MFSGHARKTPAFGERSEHMAGELAIGMGEADTLLATIGLVCMLRFDALYQI